jgi:hypothetical protein
MRRRQVNDRTPISLGLSVLPDEMRGTATIHEFIEMLISAGAKPSAFAVLVHCVCCFNLG